MSRAIHKPTHKPWQTPSGDNDPTAYAAIGNVMRETPPQVVRFETDIPPSVNHAYTKTRQGGLALSKESRAWIADAKLIAGAAKRKHGWRFSEHGKLIMELWAYWPDERRRDIHNLHKLIADAFEGVLYRNDRNLMIRDMDFTVDRRRPRVEIVVRGVDDD